MKPSLVIPAILSLSIVALAAVYGASRLSRTPEPVGSVSASDLGRIEERLLAMEGRLEELSKLSAEVDRLSARETGPVGASPAARAALSTEPERVALEAREALPGQPDGEAAPSKLENWLVAAGMREDFDGLVSNVYEQARDKRRQREQQEAEERALEMKALAEGPYGKHNYQVNSLAKKLNLDARQKDYLFSLLGSYDDRRKVAMQEAMESAGPFDRSSATPQAIEERMQQGVRVHQQLQQQFEADLLLTLSPNQQEAYKDLSEYERAGGSGMDVKMFALGGGKLPAPEAMPLQMEVRQALREVKTQLDKVQPAGK